MKNFFSIITVVLFSITSTYAQQYDPPVTFNDTSINYDLVDFGGNYSSIVTDPAGGTNLVAMTTKPPSAATWSGTSMGLNGFATALPFTPGDTKMRLRIYAPAAGIPVRLKVEDSGNGAISVETEDTTSVVNGWDTLEFDFTKRRWNHSNST